jgi:hypothetical protein
MTGNAAGQSRVEPLGAVGGIVGAPQSSAGLAQGLLRWLCWAWAAVADHFGRCRPAAKT